MSIIAITFIRYQWRLSMGALRCKGDDANQWGNGKFNPYNAQTHNRLSAKVAHVIRSWISTNTQNLIMIPQWVSFPVCAKLRIKDVYSASFSGSSNSPQPPNRSSHVIRQSTRFRARMCLLVVRKQNFKIYTP